MAQIVLHLWRLLISRVVCQQMVFISSQTNTLNSVEGVWSLGGEARFVLATQDPVGEGELDLRVLQSDREKKKGGEILIKTNRIVDRLEINWSSVASFRTARWADGGWNPEEEAGFYCGGFITAAGQDLEPVQRETRNWSRWTQNQVQRPWPWTTDRQRPWIGSLHTHMELLDGGSATLVGGNNLDLHDLDWVGPSAMASSHITIWQEENIKFSVGSTDQNRTHIDPRSQNVFTNTWDLQPEHTGSWTGSVDCIRRMSGACSWHVLTALRDGSRGRQVSVLSVHVVGSTARVVAEPDAKVLHLQRRFLVDLGGSRTLMFSHGLNRSTTIQVPWQLNNQQLWSVYFLCRHPKDPKKGH